MAAIAEVSGEACIRIQQFRDLNGIIEVHDNDTKTVKYTTFYLFTDDDVAYFGQVYKKKGEITLQEYSEALSRIPDEAIYPIRPVDTTLTVVAPETPISHLYVKRPSLLTYEETTDPTFAEALVLEYIAQAPHPNLGRYHGCRVRRDRITGIVLDQYKVNLYDFLLHDGGRVDREKFMARLESAVDHLHQLGLAHNDINPNNVMVEAEDMPILIDFGSCQPFGKRVLTGGTVGWFNEPFFLSAQEHDAFGLEKLRRWLENPTQP
jgi:serine/threonine protein kinase